MLFLVLVLLLLVCVGGVHVLCLRLFEHWSVSGAVFVCRCVCVCVHTCMYVHACVFSHLHRHDLPMLRWFVNRVKELISTTPPVSVKHGSGTKFVFKHTHTHTRIRTHTRTHTHTHTHAPTHTLAHTSSSTGKQQKQQPTITTAPHPQPLRHER